MNTVLKTFEKNKTAYAESGTDELLSHANYLKSLISRNPEKTLQLILVARQLADRGKYVQAASCMAVASMTALQTRKLARSSARKLAEETAVEWAIFVNSASRSAQFRNAVINGTAREAKDGSPLAAQAKLLRSGFPPAVPANAHKNPSTIKLQTIGDLKDEVKRVVTGEIPTVTTKFTPPPVLESIIPKLLRREGPATKRIPVAAPVMETPTVTVGTDPFTPSYGEETVLAQKSPPILIKMKQASRWMAKRAPAFVTGAAVGSTLRVGGNYIVTHFALAALAATAPAAISAIAAIGSAVVIGAVAGGASNLVKTWAWGTKEEKQENDWKRAAFRKGMGVGAVSGLIGFVAADYFQGSGVLKNLLPNSAVPVSLPILPFAIPVASHEFVTSFPQATVFHPVPNIAPFGVDKLLSPAEIARHHISSELVKMTSSRDPETLMRACKEIAHQLQNEAPRNPAKAMDALQRALFIYDRTDPHTWVMEHMAKQVQEMHTYAMQHSSASLQGGHGDQFMQQMHANLIRHTKLMDKMADADHANLAYNKYQLFEKVSLAAEKVRSGDLSGMKWVKETFGESIPIDQVRSQLRDSAIAQARLSGHAIHDYGSRLLHLLKATPAS